MNAIVTAATIRGRAALDEVRALFDQLYVIDSDIADLESKGLVVSMPYGMTADDVSHILHNRRDAVLNKLENKGIRIAPDPVQIGPPQIEE